MSRKNRYRKIARRKAAPVQKDTVRRADPVTQARILSSMDGYSNAAAFLGADSPLSSAGTFIRSGLTANTQLLTTAYRENWLATRIIDTPAEDMTRAWYTLTAEFPSEDLEKLKRLEARHSIRQELTDAIRWGRLYGGALAVIVIRGDAERMDQPLNLEWLAPDCFQGLWVLDRATGISPSLELETDLDDPDYGLPMYYTVETDAGEMSSMKIHHSRVLRFTGRELPRMETISENYWGASELEHLWDVLERQSSISANIAELVFRANITTLKMSDFGDSVAMSSDEGREAVRSLISEENRFRTSFGLQLLSRDDSMETHPYAFTGLSDIYESTLMDVAGAAEIPATRLFGRSPQGFQSTGESDMRNYYEMIAALQERHLRPALERLLPVMAISCWGYLPKDLSFVFNPLATETPDNAAELVGKLSAPVIEAYKAGLISRESGVDELKARGEPYAMWTKIESAVNNPDFHADIKAIT